MFPPRTWIRAGKVTVAAFVWLFHCAFWNVSSNRLPDKRHSHIGCICLSFLHCGFSYVSSNRLRDMMHTHIGCICLIFLCPLSLSLKPDWLCFYYNLWVQNFDPFPASSLLQFLFPTESTYLFWIVGTEIESESQNRFSRLRKFGPPKKSIIDILDFPKYHFDRAPLPWSNLNTIKCEYSFKPIKIGWFYGLFWKIPKPFVLGSKMCWSLFCMNKNYYQEGRQGAGRSGVVGQRAYLPSRASIWKYAYIPKPSVFIWGTLRHIYSQ